MGLFARLILLLALQGAAASEAAQRAAACDVAAVGGGWSGIYFAYRYLTGSKVPGDKICVFEATERIGGRTFSVPFDINNSKGKSDKFVLDVGAYRFSPDMHLPGDLILHDLKLPTECYEPDCEPANKDFPAPFIFNYTAPLRRIVDATTGQPAGYVTAMDTMVKALKKAGAWVALEKKLVDIRAAERDSAELVFQDGTTVNAGTVLLNLPRTPMTSLPAVKASSDRTQKILKCTKFDHPKSLFKNMTMAGKNLVKAYAFYDNAWWHGAVNETVGQWPTNAFFPIETSEGIPIGIHFSDGPVVCDSPGKGCRGFLEVYYAVDNETFFSDLRTSDINPSGVVKADSDSSRAKLATLHAAIMQATKPLFTAKKLTQPTTPPSMLVAGVWNREGHGFTAPTKVYYSLEMGDSIDKACGVSGLTEQEYRDTVLTPFGKAMPRVHLANNDWVAQEVSGFFGDWAEETLLQAERALLVLGLPKPSFLNATYYDAKIVALAPSAVPATGAVVI